MATHPQAIVAHRWPQIWKALQQSPAPSGVEWIESPKARTARIDGITLGSAWNPVAEARLQAATVPEGTPRIHVYGLGTGALPRELLQRERLESLVVVLLSPSIAGWSLQHFPHGDWMGDPRVDLVLAESWTTLEHPHIAIPACLRLCDPSAILLRDALLTAINDAFLANYFQGMEGVLDRRLEQARDRIAGDADVRELFGCAAGRPVVVVAGGPTASEQFHWMREEREGLVILATTTALLPMQRAGIFPDVAVVFDPAPRIIRHLEGLSPVAMRQTPLVYLPTVHPDVLDFWEGPGVVAYQDLPRFHRMDQDLSRGTLFCSGTVTHAAVDLAVQMGGSPVILAGADFAHPKGNSHLDGATIPTDTRTEGRRHPHLPNGRGNSVPSTLALIGYLRDLETYIGKRPGTRFLNTGRQGAVIRGAPWMREAA